VAGIIRQTRIEDPLNFRVLAQELGNGHRIFTLPLNPQEEGPHATHQKPFFHRTQHGARKSPMRDDPLPQFRRFAHGQHARQDIRMTAEVFRCGVTHDIRP